MQQNYLFILLFLFRLLRHSEAIFINHCLTGLSVFMRLRFVMSVCPSVRMEQLGSHWDNCYKILYFRIFQTSVGKVQASTKSDKSSEYFTLTFSHLMTYIYIYIYICRTAPLTSRCCSLYIYSTNIHTEYFKHAAHSPFFPLQNAVYFIMLPSLVPVLFTF